MSSLDWFQQLSEGDWVHLHNAIYGATLKGSIQWMRNVTEPALMIAGLDVHTDHGWRLVEHDPKAVSNA